MKFIKIILFVFVAVFHSSLFGQIELKENQALKFKHYSLTEGLSQSSVICVLQDSAGFLWFGTRDGLNKFNGHNFITYRHTSQNENSLSNSFIRSLFEDDNGTLWVGTMNGLNKYNAVTDDFQRVGDEVHGDFSINKEIWDIKEDEHQNLWLATNLGLEKINIQKKSVIERISTESGLSNNDTRSLWGDKNGKLWICNTEKIDVLNPSINAFTYYSYPDSTIKKETDNYAPVLYEDTQGILWLGYENGLWFLNKTTEKFEKFQINSKKIKSIDSEVRSIHQDYLGVLWVGTYTGVYTIDTTKTIIKQYQHDDNVYSSLSQNSVYKVFEDSKHDIWIGTYAGGVNYYDRSYDLFKNFTSGITKSNLNYKVVSSIVEDDAHNLWIGTEGGGVNFYNKETGFFQYFTHDSNDPKSLSADNVKTILKTKKGNLWIGTHDGGLNFLNLQKKERIFKKYKKNPNNTASISSNRIISLYEDEKNTIWIGTSGGGLNMFSNNKITRIKDSLNILSTIIYTISKTSDSDVLLIGGDKGLVKFHTITKKIEAVNYRGTQNKYYSISAILDVFEDASQNLWIATEGDGLYYYDCKTKKALVYDMNNGLPNEVIYSVIPDANNNLWLSTNNGLSRLNLTTLKFENFNVSDGLTSNEFNHGAFVNLSNNDLMFGGANGLNYFNPNDIVESSFTPPISITSILVNNKPFFTKDSVVNLSYDQNVFSFNFVSLGYSKPKKSQYAYRLDGFDEDWNYVGDKRSATYTNLDAGTYYFKVKASNSNGIWNENGPTLKVNINPAPWKTWWAYLIYDVIFVVILLIIRKYSLLRIYEKNQLKQERLEKEKLEEINQLKLQLFTNISHDFRTPLTLIIGPLERMLKEEKLNDFVQGQLESMHRNAKTLLQLMNQLLDFRKSESGKLELKASKNNIVPFVEDVKKSFDELARIRNIDFSFEAAFPEIEVWFDAINLKKVIFNLLSNAFKFTADNGKIEIQIQIVKESKKRKTNTAKEFLKIVVKDNGIGVPSKKIKFIFDRFYQLDQKENTRSGTGIGLALTKSLIELHKGSISVESEEGKGCVFNVLLPMGKEHLKKNQMFDFVESEDNNHVLLTNKSDYKEQNPKPFVYVADNEEVNVSNDDITLLIVEDNNEVRSFIKETLKKEYRILEAENGEIALEITKKHNIDLIISDVMMPVMDGMELCDILKTNIATSHIPVILLTAKTSEESQNQGYKFGADAYILKPFDANVLEVRVRNLIKARTLLIEKYRKDIILEPTNLKVESTDELFLQKAIGLIEENMLNPEYTIQNFISEIGMSRSALYRKLKVLTNQTITEFIRTIKLKRAKQLIMTSQLNISEIAFSLGFNDLKHFRKMFKELFNELPSQCRLNNSNFSENEEADS